MGGVHSTHIANSSSETILASVRKDRRYTQSRSTSSSSGFGAEGVNFNASASNSETYFWDLCLKEDFTEIQPGQYQQFQIKTAGEADNLYVFVMRKVNGKCELKVGGLPIRSDTSWIFKESNKLAEAKHGTIWQE